MLKVLFGPASLSPLVETGGGGPNLGAVIWTVDISNKMASLVFRYLRKLNLGHFPHPPDLRGGSGGEIWPLSIVIIAQISDRNTLPDCLKLNFLLPLNKNSTVNPLNNNFISFCLNLSYFTSALIIRDIKGLYKLIVHL